jgi:type 1 glutamine amidotransferase
MTREVRLAVLLAVMASLPLASVVCDELPPSRSPAEVKAVLAQAPQPPDVGSLRELNVLLLADVKDHGPGEHDYPLWQKQWQSLLANHPDRAPKVHVATASRWPSEEQLAKADLLVMYCYPAAPKVRVFDHAQVEQLAAFVARGGGFVPIHSATYTVADLSQEDGQKLLSVTGLMFPKAIQYRHGPVELKIADASHPICVGLPQTIRFVDEPYWPPAGDLGKVEVLATSDETASPGADGHSPQPMFWTHRHGNGRVFGCVMGHYMATFDDPFFRILLLRGMAWAAGESPYRWDHLSRIGTAD